MRLISDISYKITNRAHKKRLYTSLLLAKDTNSKPKEYILLKHLLLEHYGLDEFSYLDLGCSDPIEGSFTYDFYKSGSYGVCIDANPLYKDRFKNLRPKDKFINAGITDSNDGDERDFYIMSNKVSSSFDKKWAESASIHHDIHIEETIQVKLRHINSIMREYFSIPPDLLLLDLEGLDFGVLKSMDFNKYRPKIIMLEAFTIPCTSKSAFAAGKKVADFLKPLRYYWFTRINENSVFVDIDRFNRKNIFSLV